MSVLEKSTPPFYQCTRQDEQLSRTENRQLLMKANAFIYSSLLTRCVYTHNLQAVISLSLISTLLHFAFPGYTWCTVDKAAGKKESKVHLKRRRLCLEQSCMEKPQASGRYWVSNSMALLPGHHRDSCRVLVGETTSLYVPSEIFCWLVS